MASIWIRLLPLLPLMVVVLPKAIIAFLIIAPWLRFITGLLLASEIIYNGRPAVPRSLSNPCVVSPRLIPPAKTASKLGKLPER